jgi:hypothetical protein
LIQRLSQRLREVDDRIVGDERRSGRAHATKDADSQQYVGFVRKVNESRRRSAAGNSALGTAANQTKPAQSARASFPVGCCIRRTPAQGPGTIIPPVSRAVPACDPMALQRRRDGNGGPDAMSMA